MNLVERVPWQAEVIDAPPARLNYREIEVPSDLEVTYIGVVHDMVGGAPDYMRNAFEETDILIQEGPGWDKAMAREFQNIANGSYTALKSALEGVERQKRDAPGLAEWNGHYFRQLYESNVRLALADYPKGHPKAGDEIRLLRKAAIVSDEELFPVLAQRDSYILATMADKVSELRRMVPDIQSKSPLRVLMLFGASHYAVHDALAAAAEEQGVAPFDSKLQFQESAALMFDYENLAYGVDVRRQALADARQRATDYQNWLRTPED